MQWQYMTVDISQVIVAIVERSTNPDLNVYGATQDPPTTVATVAQRDVALTRPVLRLILLRFVLQYFEYSKVTCIRSSMILVGTLQK